jgi:hypothetical protein
MSDEAESKKSILQKLFLPVHIKIPIAVIAALAAVVTAVYVIRTVDPEINQSEILSEKAVRTIQGKKGKALIEGKTAAPEDQFKPAEEHSPKTEQRKVPATSYKSLDMWSQHTLRGEKPEMSGISGIERQTTRMTVHVKALDSAIGDTEKAVEELEGEIIRSEASGNTYSLTVQIPFGRLNTLEEKLKRIGEIEEGPVSLDAEQGSEIQVRIVETEVRLR